MTPNKSRPFNFRLRLINRTCLGLDPFLSFCTISRGGINFPVPFSYIDYPESLSDSVSLDLSRERSNVYVRRIKTGVGVVKDWRWRRLWYRMVWRSVGRRAVEAPGGTVMVVSLSFGRVADVRSRSEVETSLSGREDGTRDG